MKLKLKVKVVWWVPLYLSSIRWFCQTFNTQPDYVKLGELIKRNVKVVHVNCKTVDHPELLD